MHSHSPVGQGATINIMTISDSLLDIICCPVSHEPLQPLDRRRLKSLNKHIADGQVQYVDHTTVEDRARAALITRDGKVIYLVTDGIPVLLPERGIGTAQFKEPL